MNIATYPGVAQLVERMVWDHDAAGSNPVTRTIWAFSSIGQSIRLITGRFRVQVPEGPP